ncbi:MAG: hypothetical protein WBL68_06360 [Nitrososphaeraceae archaeon]
MKKVDDETIRETGSRHNIEKERIKEEKEIDLSMSISCDCCEGFVGVPLS